MMLDMMRERLADFWLIVRASGLFPKKRKPPESIRRLSVLEEEFFCSNLAVRTSG